MPDAGVRPYIGAGINDTVFFDEQTSGPLAGSDAGPDTSPGRVFQLGADIDIGRNLSLNAQAR